MIRSSIVLTVLTTKEIADLLAEEMVSAKVSMRAASISKKGHPKGVSYYFCLIFETIISGHNTY